MIAGLGSSPPHTADIVDGIAGLGGLRFGVGAVGVVQLGGGDGNSHRTAARIILIGRGFRARCTLLNIFAGSVAGADVCAALGGVDGTDSRQAAVYIHLGILQIRIGTGIGFAGSIGNRLELTRTPDKVIRVPFIAVINVDILTIGDRQVSTLSNIDLNACQQSRRLIDSQFAAVGQVYGHIICKRQNIVAGVDAHARQFQFQFVDIGRAVDRIDNSVRAAVIGLGKASGNKLEHAVFANKRD